MDIFKSTARYKNCKHERDRTSDQQHPIEHCLWSTVYCSRCVAISLNYAHLQYSTMSCSARLTRPACYCTTWKRSYSFLCLLCFCCLSSSFDKHKTIGLIRSICHSIGIPYTLYRQATPLKRNVQKNT